MTIPGTFDIEIVRGCKFGPITFLYKDSVGVARNLTGYTVQADFRKLPSKSLAGSLGATITTAASGEITMTLTDEQTDALPEGNFRWDMVLISGSGVREEPEVTGACVVKTPNSQP